MVFTASVYGGLRFTDQGPVEWIYYTEKRYADAQAEGRVVVMVFTAAWCLNCKALEQGVLNSSAMAELLERPDVAPIKVDITGRNPAGRERLRQTGHLSIPLIVVYAPDGGETMKRSFYTAAEVIAAVEAAGATR
jgi:thiol:disulfide interchange protein DsbD